MAHLLRSFLFLSKEGDKMKLDLNHAAADLCVGSVSQMEKKCQKVVEMQRLEQIREEFKKKTKGLLQFKGQ